MASIRYLVPPLNRPRGVPTWRVEWRSAETGQRTSKGFKSEAEARAFFDALTPWTPPAVAPQDAIRSRVEINEDGCWIWQLSLPDPGYGRIQVAGTSHLAHRFSYEAFVGPIPDGLQIDHLCRVRSCVNPEHLEPVTGQENRRRSPLNFVGINAAKTECGRGHAFDEDNTRHLPRSRRECKTCRREAVRRRRAQARLAANPQGVAA